MAYFDLSTWRKVLASGSDALEWLEDLVSAGLAGFDGPRRSLLLTPTGRIRAEFVVMPFEDGLLLIQDPVQPKAIDALLAPYVLSSDVKLLDRSELSLFAIPDGTHLGFTFDRSAGDPEDLDEWRIHQGIPRFGVDLDEESLPQEAGWDRFIDFTKGCFMGQEAMARIQNFGGHPTRVVRAMRANRPVVAGEPVLSDGAEVGIVTSASGTDLIARVRWDARDAELRTSEGVELSDRA